MERTSDQAASLTGHALLAKFWLFNGQDCSATYSRFCVWATRHRLCQFFMDSRHILHCSALRGATVTKRYWEARGTNEEITFLFLFLFVCIFLLFLLTNIFVIVNENLLQTKTFYTNVTGNSVWGSNSKLGFFNQCLKIMGEIIHQYSCLTEN